MPLRRIDDVNTRHNLWILQESHLKYFFNIKNSHLILKYNIMLHQLAKVQMKTKNREKLFINKIGLSSLCVRLT